MVTQPQMLPIEHTVVNLCADLARKLKNRDINVAAEQLLDGFGGIANLYLEQLIAASRTEIRVLTYNTFASQIVPLQRIIREIAYCIGCEQETATVIASEIDQFVSGLFRACHRTDRGTELSLSPLGVLSIETLDNFSYSFTYRDPAADTHSIYLLGKRARSESVSFVSESEYFEGTELATIVEDELNQSKESIAAKQLRVENDVDASVRCVENFHANLVKLISLFVSSSVKLAPQGSVLRFYMGRREPESGPLMMAVLTNVDAAAFSVAYSLLFRRDLDEATTVGPRMYKHVTMTMRDGGQLTLSLRVPGTVPVRGLPPARRF